MRDGTWLDKEADTYYEKLGIQCATAEEFKRWFKAAQKCYVAGPRKDKEDFRVGRRLKSFCQDCTPAYEAQMTQEGKCVKNCPLITSPTTAK